MKSWFLRLVVCVLAVAFLATSALAAPFGNELKLVRARGLCQAKSPGVGDFTVAVDSEIYPYGTAIRTGPDSSAVVMFSTGNGCRILANTTVSITEDPHNRGMKILRLLSEGSLQVMLQSDYRKHNQLRVETPSAVYDVLGSDLQVEYKIVGELDTSRLTCTKGAVDVLGNFFSMTDIGSDEQIIVQESDDNTFVRIKMERGDSQATIQDADGAEKKVALATGDEMEIFIKESADKTDMLTVLYKINYADPGKNMEIVQTETEARPLQKMVLAPPGAVTPGADWTKLTVATPELVSYTPVGKLP